MQFSTKEKALEWLEELDENELVVEWNEYVQRGRWHGDDIFTNTEEDFQILFGHLTVYQIATMLNEWSAKDAWLKMDAYGYPVSTDNVVNWIDMDSLAESLVDESIEDDDDDDELPPPPATIYINIED
jgi:hypothetical protein